MRPLSLAFPFVAILATGPTVGKELRGPAEVIDGDTLRIGEVTVRLFGIDAPEHSQSCNSAAVKASGAQVFLAGDDAAAKMVAAGLAADLGLRAVDLGALEAAWMAEVMADTFRQAMQTSPVKWRQALVFADLS